MNEINESTVKYPDDIYRDMIETVMYISKAVKIEISKADTKVEYILILDTIKMIIRILSTMDDFISRFDIGDNYHFEQYIDDVDDRIEHWKFIHILIDKIIEGI